LSICSAYPEAKTFFENKTPDWILAGLSKHASKMPPEWWNIARKNTNLAESSHHQDNYYAGIRNSLLESILK
jgi:hypothetical protein